MTTIAVIDKHPIVRMGLALFLKNNFKETLVLESESLHRFDQSQPDENPDLFILGYAFDLQMDHQEVIVKLRKKYVRAKIIVYDGYPEYSRVAAHLRSGVTGYISKSSDIPELLKCVSEVNNGRTYIGNEVMEVLLPKLLVGTSKTRYKGKETLTDNEAEIARSLANGDNVTAIAQNRHRSLSTISTIKKNIFKKLNISHIMDLSEALERTKRI